LAQVGRGHAGGAGHLLLGEPARLAQLADVAGQVVGDLRGHAGRVALCHHIGKRDGLMAERTYALAMNIRDTSSLVTGASRGLGLALARRLAAAGSRVVLVAREREPLERAAADIRAAGGTAHAVAADIGDKNAIYALTGQAAGLVGPIDILVNNASTLGPSPLRLLLDTDCEDLERALAVNLVGPFRLSKVLAGSMALRRRGVIVNVSSDAAVEPYPTWGAYAASKAGLDQLGRVWAAELADHGVRLLTVDPGEMDTHMHAEAMPDADRASLADPSDIAARIVAMIASEDDRAPTGSRLVAPRFEVHP
jgi:NAD(P)-dependent dehydrogenase (short-subunit alcohol dehydrogenase family)